MWTRDAQAKRGFSLQQSKPFFLEGSLDQKCSVQACSCSMSVLDSFARLLDDHIDLLYDQFVTDF